MNHDSCCDYKNAIDVKATDENETCDSLNATCANETCGSLNAIFYSLSQTCESATCDFWSQTCATAIGVNVNDATQIC